MYLRACVCVRVFFYRTCRFSQLFDLLMSLRQIFCKISLAKFSDMCVRELRIFMALWAAAFLSRVSFKRICVVISFISDEKNGDDDSSNGRQRRWGKKRKKKKKRWIFMENLSMMCGRVLLVLSFSPLFLCVTDYAEEKVCADLCVRIQGVSFFFFIEIEIDNQNLEMMWKRNMQFSFICHHSCVVIVVIVVNVCSSFSWYKIIHLSFYRTYHRWKPIILQIPR